MIRYHLNKETQPTHEKTRNLETFKCPIIFKKRNLIVSRPTRGGNKPKPANVCKLEIISQYKLIARKAKVIKNVVSTKPKVPTKGMGEVWDFL